MRYQYENQKLEHPRDKVLAGLLQQRGMVTHLARHLGITPQAISKWRRVPDHHVPAIAKLLGVTQKTLRSNHDV